MFIFLKTYEPILLKCKIRNFEPYQVCRRINVVKEITVNTDQGSYIFDF